MNFFFIWFQIWRYILHISDYVALIFLIIKILNYSLIVKSNFDNASSLEIIFGSKSSFRNTGSLTVAENNPIRVWKSLQNPLPLHALFVLSFYTSVFVCLCVCVRSLYTKEPPFFKAIDNHFCKNIRLLSFISV